MTEDLQQRVKDLEEELAYLREQIANPQCETGLQCTKEMSSGEIRLVLEVGPYKGDLYLSRDMWHLIGETAGWAPQTDYDLFDRGWKAGWTRCSEGIFGKCLQAWDPLFQSLQYGYRELLFRRSSAVIANGPGHTLLVRKLCHDFENSDFESLNFWHRVDRDSISSTRIFEIKNENWVQDAYQWIQTQKEDSRCVIVADDADRGFLHGLLDLNRKDFDKLGLTPYALRVAADRFVHLVRTKLRPALFLIATGNSHFASLFHEKVGDQHAGLTQLVTLQSLSLESLWEESMWAVP